MSFNSRQYEYSDITVYMAGKDVTGLRGVSYSAKQDKELLHGKGNQPISIQRGNKTYEGDITLLQSELEALIESSGGDILDINMNIAVVYGNPDNGDAIVTDKLIGVEFTEMPKSMSQGDSFMEITLPMVFLRIEKGEDNE